MDIHKPKPWHGVREFLKEYAIIVVGVLTALGAEQGVEWLHWRHQADVAREALGFDLRRALAWGGATAAEMPCVSRRLGELADDLDQAQTTKRLAPMGWSGSPWNHSWFMRSWSGLISGQALAHIPNRQQLLFAGIAQRVQYESQIQEANYRDWSDLSAMAGPGRPVTDAELVSLRLTLQHAIRNQANLKGGGDQIATMAVQTGLLDTTQIKAAWQEGVAAARAGSLCGPTPPPAPHPLHDAIHTFLDRPILEPGQAKLDSLGVAGAVSTER